ncbi:MAG: hypothetical protein K2J15_05175 [Muribaculaceae bacterium]|nr:hypothetical protein [Muribaculaceae bacterium]
MKKITTMIAAVSLGIATMVAAPVETGVRTDLRVTGATDAFRKWQNNIAVGSLTGTKSVETRSWVSGKNTYEVRFQLSDMPLCEMMSFDDGNGNVVNPTFDVLPYYCLQMTIYRTKEGAEIPNTLINFILAWPSEYIYSQVFDYVGELDEDNKIPVDLRNYDIVPMDELFNNPDRCRKFQESLGVGTGGDPSDGKWEYYTIVPNSVIGNPAMVDGQDAMTVIDEQKQIYSYVECMQFSPDDNWTQFYSYVYWSADGSTNGLRNLRIGSKTAPYDGTTDVQGFYSQVVEMPEFGDLHIFNTGAPISSESLGDNNPFPAEFPEVSALFFTVGDKYIKWDFDPDETGDIPFDRDKFTFQPIEYLPAGESLRDHANFVDGYLFADPKYSKDTSLDLEPADFVVQPVTEVEIDNDAWYAVSAPMVNSMIPYSVGDMNNNMEAWSSEYGAALTYRNLPETCWDPSFIGWGYKEGLVINFENRFHTNYIAYSTGKIYYHYNPKNMRDYRELSPFGERDEVETVAADAAGVKVNAANGVISVTVSNDAEVAVYGLDGVCLKAVKAVAGENVNVEAAKGVYVVKAGEKAVKVAL